MSIPLSKATLQIRHQLSRVFCGANLQFQTEQHDEEDKTEAEEADGEADQPSEHSPLPWRIVELFTACYGAATFYTLRVEKQGQKNSKRPPNLLSKNMQCSLLDLTVMLTLNCGLGSSKDSAGVSRVPHL